MITLKTDNVLHTLLDIAMGIHDREIYKLTRGKITHFPDLGIPGKIIIYFDAGANAKRDIGGRFAKKNAP